ncbi:acetolactate synthase large subunit biosynthetic [Lucifera butyrica]|uniref:Acetolactate synthase n=1 Tax=Lucifera butyrica TaxID=1351585 RepID=A0A498R9E8_9FIRM|nr:biosynthetic-type acetolactate synthase large subunit [Lucifera butyrica]VBB06892.1 acetolactate synthase large subunit biosynthetic [Lucifera butyrica]
MKMTGARAIVECLLEQGVDTLFGFPGGTILPLYDALQNAPLRHILTVHEQGAAHAADGYARASGKVGVCIATSGPGATNLVTGLAAAFMDSVPVIAITGQVPTTLIGRDAFQEVDITGITMPITKHNFQVKNPAKLVEMLRQAFRIARSGRPGPVLIDIPRDVQTAVVEFEAAATPVRMPWQPSSHTDRLLKEAAGVIRSAQKPVVIVGGGVITGEAHQEVQQLAEKSRIPVVSTLMGLGAFPASHRQFLGLTGMHGHKLANNVVHAADVIIAVGSRFSDRVTGNRASYADNKVVIHIDVDPAEIDKNVAAGIGLAGEIRLLLQRLTDCVPGSDRDDWWLDIDRWRQEYKENVTGEELTGSWVMKRTAELAQNSDCTFVTDVGQHQMWAAQHLKIEKPREWLTSGGLGAMGFGLPAALGAQAAVPHKRVVLIAGDGGFKMTGGELYTVSCYDLPVTVIVIHNQGLGMIRQLQHVFFDRHYCACVLPDKMDFALYARAFGIEANTVCTREEFSETFATSLQATKPQVIVVKISGKQLVQPMIAPGAALNEYVDFT